MIRCGPAALVLVTACAAAPERPRAPRAPRATVGASSASAEEVPRRPTPIVLARSVDQPVRSPRAELEAIAMRSGNRNAAEEALFELALLDVAAEEAAWDGPDPELVAGSARARAIGNEVPKAAKRLYPTREEWLGMAE